MLAESSNDQTDDRKFYGGLGFEIFVRKKRYGVTNRKTKVHTHVKKKESTRDIRPGVRNRIKKRYFSPSHTHAMFST